MAKQKDLLVKILKSIIEENYQSIVVEDDSEITGYCNYGFVTEEGIYCPEKDEDLDAFKKQFGIPVISKYGILELGNINDIQISYNQSYFDIKMMDDIAEDVYQILGSKFNLMTVEAHPAK